MKRIVRIYGLIISAFLVANLIYMTVMCYTDPNFMGNTALGYAAMIIVFSIIFIAVKNYRDKHCNGTITFGKAFKTGVMITLIASSVYVVVWLFEYYLFIPDFIDKYTLHVLNAAKSDGATAAEISKKTTEMAEFKTLYKNPVFVILITYAEVLPVGLVISVISALLLKRKPKV